VIFFLFVGVTRNNNVVDVDLLFNKGRNELNLVSPRVMGVFHPILVTISNYDDLLADGNDSVNLIVPFFPDGVFPSKENGETKDESKSEATIVDFEKFEAMGSKNLDLTREIWIDAGDFRSEDSSDFKGLALSKTIYLKYVGEISCVDVVYKDIEKTEV